MRVSFLTPPSFFHKQPAERSAGCTRVVVPTPNIYELSLVASIREITGVEVSLDDFTQTSNACNKFEKYVDFGQIDLVFIWSVNLSVDDDIHAFNILRKKYRFLPVIFVGPAPTWEPERFLHDSSSYVVRSEPEITAVELVNAIAKQITPDMIEGVSWRDTFGNIHHNKSRNTTCDLDSLPFPARDLIADRRYINPKLKTGPYTTAFTSRNCPFNCIFCVPSSLTFAREIEYRRTHGCKPPVAFRSIKSIDAEMAQIAAQGYKAVGFMDDNFIINEKRTDSICKLMQRHGLIWGCQARADAITPTIASLLAEGGCRYIDIGIESFDDRILTYIKKAETADDIRRSIRLLADAGISVKANVLIGSSPLETPRTVAATLREIRRLPIDQVMINIVSPFPGTEFYKICMENGWIENNQYVPTDVQRQSILRLPHLSARQMENLLFYHNLRYFLSPQFIYRQIGRFSSISEFTAALKALKIKLFG